MTNYQAAPKEITLADVRAMADVSAYIRQADDSLKAIGYTEHSFEHAALALHRAAGVLTMLDYPPRMVELARIAGYMHDIGNAVNRSAHAQSGAIMAFQMLTRAGMPPEEVAQVICAIGNHDEGTGRPVSPLAAAVILGDKTDVRRSRVRSPRLRNDDIHDRVNGAVDAAAFDLDKARRFITLRLTIDTAECSVLEYFKIFLDRMVMCQTAADTLGCTFRLVINGAVMIG